MPLPEFRLVRSARRSVCVEITPDLQVCVRAPRVFPERQIRAFLESKAGWIERTRSDLRLKRERAEAAGPGLFLEGRWYALRVDPGAAERFYFRDGFFIHPFWAAEASRAAESWYRREIRPRLEARVRALAVRENFSWKQIRISRARSRWGSCSAHGTLSFNWRLLMCPPQVMDYVIIHELCHLRELNHSRRFWRQVQALCPDYSQALGWLRENGEFLVRPVLNPIGGRHDAA